MLRDPKGCLKGLLVVHVDDVMACHDGSDLGKATTKKLYKRFPFATWQNVSEQSSGVTYCGKEIRIEHEKHGPKAVLSQAAFVDGRLQPIAITTERKKQKESPATEEEKTD